MGETASPVTEHHSPVLIVEDDVDVRGTLSDVLVDEGYEVAGAEDGAEALASLHAGLRPSVIILDLWLPRMGGLEFRAAQLAEEELANIPVVVVTAGGVAPREMAALGLAYVLRKPIDLDVLLRVIRRLSARTLMTGAHPPH
jgi:CheY-like chemotaxis protein